jgi:hypothetical protein
LKPGIRRLIGYEIPEMNLMLLGAETKLKINLKKYLPGKETP